MSEFFLVYALLSYIFMGIVVSLFVTEEFSPDTPWTRWLMPFSLILWPLLPLVLLVYLGFQLVWLWIKAFLGR